MSKAKGPPYHWLRMPQELWDAAEKVASAHGWNSTSMMLRESIARSICVEALSDPPIEGLDPKIRPSVLLKHGHKWGGARRGAGGARPGAGRKKREPTLEDQAAAIAISDGESIAEVMARLAMSNGPIK